MLDFWYSERCTRPIKLIICISTCVLIMRCGQIASLSPLFVGFSLAVGSLIHLLKMLSLKIQCNDRYTTGFQVAFFTVILIALMSIVLCLPKQHFGALLGQCLGFVGIGFTLVSIYSNRAKRFE